MGWLLIPVSKPTKHFMISFLKFRKEFYLILSSLILSFIFSITISEIYFQPENKHDLYTQFDPELGWSPKKSYSVKVDENTYSTNSLGFRSPEINPKKKHILMIGDSVTWGEKVNDNQTISFYLDQELKNQQVLNLGVSGYGLDQTYLRLKKYIGQLNPQWIILIIYSGNDLTDISTNFAYGKSKPFFSLANLSSIKEINKSSEKFSLREPSVSYYSCPNIFSKSRTLSLPIFRNLLYSVCTIKKYESGILIDELFSFLIEKIKQICKEYNANLILVLSPNQRDLSFINVDHYLKIKRLSQNPSLTTNAKPRVELYGQSENFFYLQKKIPTFGVPFIDFFSIIRKNGWQANQIFVRTDTHHLSPLGFQRLAKSLLKYLQKKRV